MVGWNDGIEGEYAGLCNTGCQIGAEFPCHGISQIQRQLSALQVSSGYRPEQLFHDPCVHIAAMESQDDPFRVLDDLPGHRTFQSQGRHTAVTQQDISEKWHIGLEQAGQTIRTTTQFGVRSAILPMARQYKADGFFQLVTYNSVSSLTHSSPLISAWMGTCACRYFLTTLSLLQSTL